MVQEEMLVIFCSGLILGANGWACNFQSLDLRVVDFQFGYLLFSFRISPILAIPPSSLHYLSSLFLISQPSTIAVPWAFKHTASWLCCEENQPSASFSVQTPALFLTPLLQSVFGRVLSNHCPSLPHLSCTTRYNGCFHLFTFLLLSIRLLKVFCNKSYMCVSFKQHHSLSFISDS